MTKEKKIIRGNISGVRATILDRLSEIYTMRTGRDEFVSPEMLETIALYTTQLNREIALCLARDGSVTDVSLGDVDSAHFASLKLTRGAGRLCGVRCIHTHPSGNARLSAVDLGALTGKKLDAICAVGVKDGKVAGLSSAFLGEKKDEQWETITLGPIALQELHAHQQNWMNAIMQAEANSKAAASRAGEKIGVERAVLVGVDDGRAPFDTLEELAQLAKTAGAQVIARESQKRESPDNATYIGRGKVEELGKIGAAQNIDLFIFDDELSPVQIRNLEQALGARVIDRTALILDIFASRANSREGKLQVELAQQKYRLPRLIGLGQSLSRLGGGIGTKGPGEKKLEVDRRRIRRQIFVLEKQIREIEEQRALRRMRREKNTVSTIALVGYTNAGKSTLLNRLSKSDVLAQDMLFATLDPVTRQLTVPGVGETLLSDTVGFIHKLPHELVQAFRSTLDEAVHADLIVHVVDASNDHYREQMQVVMGVLTSLGVQEAPMITAYNKIDVAGKFFALREKETDAVCISAATGQGVEDLLKLMEEKLCAQFRSARLHVPYARQEVAAFLRQRSRVVEETHLDEGTDMLVYADAATLGVAKKMLSVDERNARQGLN